jgi:VWFA-related protein
MNSGAVVIIAFVCLSFINLLGQAAIPASGPGIATTESNSSAASTTATAPAAVTSVPRPHFVPVLISVTDVKGSPLLELTKEQLKIVDNNQAAQPLQLFKAADIPLHLGIVLLASPATFSQQQAAATDLVQKVIRPKVDEAFVVTARGRKAWPSDRLDWKSDPAELSRTIQALDRNAGIPDAFNFNLKTDEVGSDEDAGRDTVQYFANGGVSAFDAAYAMMNSDPRPARRVLVIFREPWSHSPGFGQRVNQAVEHQMQRVIALAQMTHVSMFVIGLDDPRFNGISDNNIGKSYISLHAGDDGGAGSANREFDRQMERDRIRAYDQGKTNVQRLASETGGETFWSTKKNYSDAVSAISNRILGQYLVTFTPADVPGPVHRLKITSDANSHVLAQTAFFVGAGK